MSFMVPQHMRPIDYRPDENARAAPAIGLENVRKSFGKLKAVDNLSLHVPEGCIYGFIGPNGSGKTTTLRMIMNLIVPDGGRLSVLGKSEPSARRRLIAYLPEEKGLYKKMTAREQILYYGTLKGMPRAALLDATQTWLERLDLVAAADKRIEELSKGMGQKVQFIATVVTNPRVLILDEPFSGLDPANADVLLATILELKKQGVTILYSTHEMEVAERLCDRVCMIHKGRKVLDGTLDEVRAGADVIRLRTSGGAALLASLPDVELVKDHGNMQDVRFAGDSMDLLRKLVASTRVDRFETLRMPLHEIFVNIVKSAGGVPQ